MHLPCISDLARNNVDGNMIGIFFKILVLVVFKIFFI
jgi:hypothetical protein